jgi:hypothetical protein
LKAIVPSPIPSDLEGLRDISATSYSEKLIVYEVAQCIVVAGPKKATVRADFSRLTE